MRTVLLGCLLLSAAACFAQTGVPPSVVTGQNADGGNVVVTLIPLKYLDPVDAANLMMALGYRGTVIPVNPVHGPGEGIGSYGNGNSSGMRGGSQRGRAGTWSSSNRNNNNGTGQGYNNNGTNGYGGYNGYQSGLQTGSQYPGYQSPYSYR